MGGYVPMDKDLDDDGRVLQLRDDILEHLLGLGVPKVLTDVLKPFAHQAALGALYKLWRHGDTHLRHEVTRGVTGDASVDAALRLNCVTTASHHLAEVTGLPVTLLRHLPREWFVEHEDGTIELPGYADKNVLQDKEERRARRNARQARYRARQRARGDASRDASRDGAVTSTSVTPNPTQPISEEPLTPRSGGPGPNGHRNGNPRALGTNPRAVAKREAEAKRWKPLLERARAAGFREPHTIDTPESYETSLRLHERGLQ